MYYVFLSSLARKKAGGYRVRMKQSWRKWVKMLLTPFRFMTPFRFIQGLKNIRTQEQWKENKEFIPKTKFIVGETKEKG
jgi:hypothetical protein